MAKYTGAFPTIKTHYTHSDVLNDMKSYAIKIAKDNDYHYVKWKSKNKITHECPICHKHEKGEYYGFTAMGFAFAVWRHGAGLANNCSNEVLTEAQAEKLLKCADRKAIKIAKTNIGLKKIKVIRNNEKYIPLKSLKKGDICLCYVGKKYFHTVLYIGDGKMVDCTSGSSQISVRKMTNCKVAIRYTGTGNKYRQYIKIKDEGSQVKKLQKFLNWAIGAKLETDGIFGEKTEKAVKKFQKKCKITADGHFGKESLLNAEQFDNSPVGSTDKKEYTGTFPTLTIKKTNAEVIEDTITWAKWIAADNDFHYGYTNKSKSIDAHHNGCYFCGTNHKLKSAKIEEREHTYCCNPFVGAAWAHGGCVPAALELCQKCKSWDYHKGAGYDKSKLFKHLGHPSKSKLKAGDVLCRDTHVALYIGNGKIVQAGGGDDNVKNSARWNKSISVTTLTDTNYKNFPRVYRYQGSVDAMMPIRHGEVSKRVKKLQKYLNWYFGKEVVSVDGLFGDSTLRYVKTFQTAQKLAVDGVIGEMTIAKMKSVRK